MENEIKMIGGGPWPGSCNVFIIEGAKGPTMIDVGCGGEQVDKLFEKMEAKGFSPKNVGRVIVTHAHPDHMGGISAINETANPEVITHELEKESAEEPDSLIKRYNIGLISKHLFEGEIGLEEGKYIMYERWRTSGCPMTHTGVDRTVGDGDVIETGGLNLRVLHTPGHSPGHISLYCEETRSLVSGDILGPVVAWYSPSTGGAKEYLSSLDKLEKLGIEKILPSHGDIIEDPLENIEEIRGKILEREALVLDELESGPRSFKELNSVLSENLGEQGNLSVLLLESHLLKLEDDGKIKRDDDMIGLRKRG